MVLSQVWRMWIFVHYYYVFLLYSYHCLNSMHHTFALNFFFNYFNETCISFLYYTATFTVTLFTNHSMVFITFSVSTIFPPNIGLKVHISVKKIFGYWNIYWQIYLFVNIIVQFKGHTYIWTFLCWYVNILHLKYLNIFK